MRAAIDSFLNFMTVERGVSPNTLLAYRNDLNQLATYVENFHADTTDCQWDKVDDQVLTAYLLRLHE